jgi:hypothetical protein
VLNLLAVSLTVFAGYIRVRMCSQNAFIDMQLCVLELHPSAVVHPHATGGIIANSPSPPGHRRPVQHQTVTFANKNTVEKNTNFFL